MDDKKLIGYEDIVSYIERKQSGSPVSSYRDELYLARLKNILNLCKALVSAETWQQEDLIAEIEEELL